MKFRKLITGFFVLLGLGFSTMVFASTLTVQVSNLPEGYKVVGVLYPDSKYGGNPCVAFENVGNGSSQFNLNQCKTGANKFLLELKATDESKAKTYPCNPLLIDKGQAETSVIITYHQDGDYVNCNCSPVGCTAS